MHIFVSTWLLLIVCIYLSLLGCYIKKYAYISLYLVVIEQICMYMPYLVVIETIYASIFLYLVVIKCWRVRPKSVGQSSGGCGKTQLNITDTLRRSSQMSWDRFASRLVWIRVTLGTRWSHDAVTMGSLWDNFGSRLGHVGLLWDYSIINLRNPIEVNRTKKSIHFSISKVYT